MTPSKILDIARNQIYESGSEFWSDQEIYDYMWVAEQDIANDTLCYETTDTSTSTVADTQGYSLPSDCLHVLRVEYDSVKLKRIEKIDQDTIDSTSYGSDLSTGDPTSYWQYGTTIYLYPIPDEAKTLTIYYNADPAALDEDSTSFSVPAIFHRAILEYTLHMCYAKDNNEGKSAFHLQKYYQELEKARLSWHRRGVDANDVVRNEDIYQSTELGMI